MAMLSMDLETLARLDGPADAAFLRAAEGLDGPAVLRAAISAFPGQVAVVSSFGAESAVLLSLVAETDRGVPVLFLETGKHFDETLDYRHALAARLGLRDVRDIRPAADDLARADADGDLWVYDPDACCHVRKVTPLARALAPFAAWVSGRKRHQAATRASIRLAEREGGRLRLNPLADWNQARLAAEIEARGLPAHPLVARGYPSIGCATCTQPVAPGADPRSGRWAGLSKTECGIHRPEAIAA